MASRYKCVSHLPHLQPLGAFGGRVLVHLSKVGESAVDDGEDTEEGHAGQELGHVANVRALARAEAEEGEGEAQQPQPFPSVSLKNRQHFRPKLIHAR